MPWTGREFAERHNHKLSGQSASKAAEMASAMVREGVPEGTAIATANKYGNKLAQRHAAGGFIGNRYDTEYGAIDPDRMPGGDWMDRLLHNRPMHYDPDRFPNKSERQAPATRDNWFPTDPARDRSQEIDDMFPRGYAEGGTPSEVLDDKISRLWDLERRNAEPEGSGTFYRRLLENGGGEPIPLRASGGGIGSSVHMMPMHGIGANLNNGHEGSSHGIAPSMQTPWWTKAAAHQMTATPKHDGGIGGFAAGGMMSASQASPWWEKSEARIMDQPFHSGLLNSAGAGRTDNLPLSVASDSHVIPADVVSGLAQGNTLAGGRILDAAMKTGPMGIPLAHYPHGRGPPAPPHIGQQHSDITAPTLASGGSAHPKTSILAAGGEYVVSPEDVYRIGEGDMQRGHDLIDKMIGLVRAYVIKWMKNAPPPKK